VTLNFFDKIFIVIRYIFQIIVIGSLWFPKLKGKINFDLRLYFSYFLIPSVREIRENHRNPMLEIENLYLH
jgi:hypothetical protein